MVEQLDFLENDNLERDSPQEKSIIITNNLKVRKDESGNQLLKDSSYIDSLGYWYQNPIKST